MDGRAACIAHPGACGAFSHLWKRFQDSPVSAKKQLIVTLKKKPTLSILIANWNTCELLASCLASINRGLDEFRPGDIETIVVDNGSVDNSVNMLRQQFPHVQLLENAENLGFARANNQAIRRSQGRYVLMLNSDAQLVPGALRAMINFLEQTPRAGIASVCLAFPDNSPQFCYGDFPNLRREFKGLFGLHHWDLSPWGNLKTPMQVDWVAGACLMARRKMLDQIGLLDEESFMFGEEVDLCYRAAKASWGVFVVPSPPIIHVRAGSTGKTPERTVRLYQGKLMYANKHFGRLRSKALALLMYVSVFGKMLFFGACSLIKSRCASQRAYWQDTLNLMTKQ